MRAMTAALVMLAGFAGCMTPTPEAPPASWPLGPPSAEGTSHAAGDPCFIWGAWRDDGAFAAFREAARTGRAGATVAPMPESLPLHVEALEAQWNGPALTRLSVERIIEGAAATLALRPTEDEDAYALSAMFPHGFRDGDVRAWLHENADAVGLPEDGRDGWADALVAAREPGMEMGRAGKGTWVVADTAEVRIRAALDLEAAYARAVTAAEGEATPVGDGAWLRFRTPSGDVLFEFTLPVVMIRPGGDLHARALGSGWVEVGSPQAPPPEEGRRRVIADAFASAGLEEPAFREWVAGRGEC